MLLGLAIVLLFVWIFGVFVARVAGMLIHLVIILALLVVALHFMRAHRLRHELRALHVQHEFSR